VGRAARHPGALLRPALAPLGPRAGAPGPGRARRHPGRRIYFFALEIWPQEIYFLTGLLILAAFLLFLASSLVGRIWCGYACPQSLWTDLFMLVERRIEGDRAARIRLDARPLDADKALRKSAKHAAWLLIAFATGGAWVTYFDDAPTVVRDVFTGGASGTVYLFVGLFTATTYLLAGWAREQVCTQMCPWPRIQSGLLDRDSLLVTYRDWRGEPRGPHKRGTAGRAAATASTAASASPSARPGSTSARGSSSAASAAACASTPATTSWPGSAARPADRLGERARPGAARGRAGAGVPPPPAADGALRRAGGARGRHHAGRARLAVGHRRQRPARPRLAVRDPLDGGIRNGYTLKLLNKAREPRVYRAALAGDLPATYRVLGQEGRDGPGPVELAATPDGVSKPSSIRHPAAGGPHAETMDVTFVITDTVTGEATRADTIFRGPRR
jgi:polyferredoxin